MQNRYSSARTAADSITNDEVTTSSQTIAKPLVSGSLFREWIKNTYPLMNRDEDYSELDYIDIQKFGFWVEEQINSGRFPNGS